MQLVNVLSAGRHANSRKFAGPSQHPSTTAYFTTAVYVCLQAA